MSKLSETITLDETTGRLLIHQTHDFNPVMEKAKALKSAGIDGGGDNKIVGLVPMKMFYEWAKKWGVDHKDGPAMEEVVAREMMDSDNAHLRVWGGKF